MSKPKIKLGIKPKSSSSQSFPAAGLMEDDFCSLQKLNEYLKEIVENNVFFMFHELLQKISDDYDIPFDEVKEKYLSYFKKNLKNSNLYSEFLSLNLTKSEFKLLHEKSPIQSENLIPVVYDENKCMAQTCSGTQCSRKKQKDYDFCGNHLHSQPYGRIDRSDNQWKEAGKSSLSSNASTLQNPRPSLPSITTVVQTSSKIVQPSEEVTQLPLEVIVETFDGIEYLVDPQSGKIFKRHDGLGITDDTNNLDLNDLMIVGQKVDADDGNKTVHWYSESDLVFLNKKN